MARPARQPILWAAAAAVAAGLVAWLWLTAAAPGVSERQLAAQMLAEDLKAALDPKAVLILANPFAEQPGRPSQVSQFDQAGVAGLRAGFGPGVALKIARPELKPEILADPASIRIDPESPTPLSFLIDSQAFDRAVAAHPDCSLVVSLIGLPVQLDGMKAWTSSGPPQFALLLPDWRVIGDAPAVENAFSRGKLAAALVPRADAAAGAALRERYQVIRSNNVAEMLRPAPGAPRR